MQKSIGPWCRGEDQGSGAAGGGAWDGAVLSHLAAAPAVALPAGRRDPHPAPRVGGEG